MRNHTIPSRRCLKRPKQGYAKIAEARRALSASLLKGAPRGDLRIALDATYSVGKNLSGVGVYSNEIIKGVADAQPDWKLVCSYRPHRFLRSFRQQLPSNCQRRVLWESHRLGSIDVFHGLNQRLPSVRYRRTVATFHDLFVLTGEYSTKEFRQRFAGQAREAAERSDLIIAVSKFTAGHVEDLLGVEPSRIRVVPHGVRLPRTLSHEGRERVVLFLGAIQRRKNVVRIIEAFERLPQRLETRPGRLHRLRFRGDFRPHIQEPLPRQDCPSRLRFPTGPGRPVLPCAHICVSVSGRGIWHSGSRGHGPRSSRDHFRPLRPCRKLRGAPLSVWIQRRLTPLPTRCSDYRRRIPHGSSGHGAVMRGRQSLAGSDRRQRPHLSTGNSSLRPDNRASFDHPPQRS